MLGFSSKAMAVATYLSCYSAGWKLGPVTSMTIGQFKSWIKDGDLTKPIAGQVSRYSMPKKGDLLTHDFFV